MANRPGGALPALPTPPELPAVPGIQASLADYLRRFSLWSAANFNSTLQKRSSTGELFIHSTTGQSVWSITVDDSGVLHTSQLMPGKGPS